MVRNVRRAARLLVTAGALGSALTAGPRLEARDPAGSRPVEVPQVTPSQARLEAMKVEMALLADPLAYRLPLQIYASGEGLELRGEVRDEAARRHAVMIARQACYMPVRDALRITTPVRLLEQTQPATLRRAVHEVLDRQLGARAAGLEVEARADGEVVLRGQVPTVEDKLAASRCLRGLPGCTSVVNRLAVPAVNRGGHTLTLVTRDGKHVVHGSLAAASPVGNVVPVCGTEPARPEKAAPAPTPELPPPAPPAPQTKAAPVVLPPAAAPVLPSGLPPSKDVYLRLRTATQVHPVVYVSPPPSGYATPAPPPAAPAQPGCAACSAAQAAPAAPAATTEQTYHTPLGQRLRVVREKILDMKHRPTVMTSPAPAPASTAPPPVAAPAPAGPALASAATGAPASVTYPPAHDVRSTQGRPSPLSLSPAVTQGARPELAPPRPTAAPAPPPPAPVPPPPAPVKPREAATEVVTVASRTPAPPPPAPAPAPVATPAAAPARLSGPQAYQLVKKASGKLAREVRVEIDAEKRVTVHVYATPGGEQELISRVLQVPEVAASDLRLQVHLAQ